MTTCKDIFKLYESHSPQERIHDPFREVSIDNRDESHSNWTPLHLACNFVDTEAVRNHHHGLVAAIINTGLCLDNTGHKAIDYATAHGLREVVARLIHAETKDSRENTPLHQAVYNGQGEIVRRLLTRSDTMLDTANDNGETPLVIACLKENLMVAKLLIDAGADVNKSLLNGNTPLHYAAARGFSEIVEILLAAGAEGYQQYTH